jgi:lysyl-tRNA synthetase, class II
MEEENQLIKQRIEKLEELKKIVNPYPYSYDVNSKSSEILEKYSKLQKEEKTEDEVKVAGRIMSMRKMGKIAFANLGDQEGKVQLFFSKQDSENFEILKHLDLGDILGIKGKIFKTKTGEITINVKEFEVLCKSLRPLPEKWHGLKDTEIRYRQRYVDLIVNPEVKEVFIKRSKIISGVREFLNEKDFIEVEIPTLQPVYGGANARPFKTHINAWDLDMFLSISPELYLKRLTVGGLEKVYTICKNFRNEGVDKTHNPEFTMMECYQAYVDYNEMMKITEEMFEFIAKKVLGKTKVDYQGTEIDFKVPWERLTMKESIKKHANVDVDKLSDDELKDLLRTHNIETREDVTRGLAIALLFEELVEDKLIQPVHITDHPKETTMLCKEKRGDKELIERFESFAFGFELCNAYSELNDSIKQTELLKEQVEKGRGGDEEAHPMDEDFVRALEYGMPPTGGLGIGIDRMVMFFTDSKTIRDVIAFPTMRPEK